MTQVKPNNGVISKENERQIIKEATTLNKKKGKSSSNIWFSSHNDTNTIAK